MSLVIQIIKTGFIKAIKTTLTLMKVVLPVYALVVLIKYSPVMSFLAKVLSHHENFPAPRRCSHSYH